MGSITAGPTLCTSSNLVVGAYNTPGAAILQRYRALGEQFTSWAVVGWMADRTGGQVGCGSVPFCRLYVYYAPDAVVGHWGSAQTFRKDPGQPVYDDNSTMVGRWAVNDAYRVERPFFAAWLGNWMQVGLPILDQIGNFPPLCDAAVGCVRYQRFHLGYIWKHVTGGVQTPVFRPDVYGNDYRVLVDDILAVVDAYFQDDSVQPYQPWPQARYDTDGNGLIRVYDALRVVAAYFAYCYPT